MTDPTVSVVIPCRNAARFLADTLRSVFDQTRQVDEVLLIDDGSTDGSPDIGASFGPMVRVIRQGPLGVSAARNRGVREARGTIVAFLDADDLWRADKIEQQIDYFRSHPDVGALVTSAAEFTEHRGERTPFMLVTDDLLRMSQPIDFLNYCWVNQSALAVRIDVARLVPYPEYTGDSEDMIQATELRLHTTIGALPDMLAFYRRHPAQTTSRPEHHVRSLVSRVNWAAANYERLGMASANAARLGILDPLARSIMPLYWRREMKRFRRQRALILSLWPHGEPVPRDLRRPAPPAPLMRFVDRIRPKLG